MTPPIRPDTGGIYAGSDGRPADVGVADPFFQWKAYGRYQSSAECAKARAELDRRSLALNPASADAVAWSFARCFAQDDPLLEANPGAVQHSPR